ncbi:hypothetical protein ABMA09_25555 (plasmid) [Erwinia rhapontici]
MKKPASTAPCQITGSNVWPGSVSGLFAQLVPVTEADMPFQCEKKKPVAYCPPRLTAGTVTTWTNRHIGNLRILSSIHHQSHCGSH